jgi:hypothetical protein
MNSPRYARLIAEVFRRGEPRAGDLSPRSNRDEEIALIEQAMDRRGSRNARLRWAALWSVAAGVVLVGFGASRFAHEKTSASPAANLVEGKDTAGAATPIAIAIASASGAIVAAPGSSAPAVIGRALHAGSRLIVDPSGGATLSLSTGTHLEVEPGSQLSVIEDNRAQIFALNTGSLHADVAKLAKDERFIVRTTDAEVEVRGTSFVVDVVPSDPACGNGTTTRVKVFEGVVIVRAGGQEDAVARGEHWPRGCRQLPTLKVPALAAPAHAALLRPAKVEPPRPPPATVGLGSAPELQPPAAQASSPAAPAQRASSSTLAEENNLFAEGMLARRNGNVPLAVEKMERFLDRYPASHLAENAAAERMRFLRALDPAKATAAARQYLQRYPNGFARAEAEAILFGTR